MNIKDVPSVLRGSLPESLAFEEGQRAGRAGVAGDGNPWLERAREHRTILNYFAAVATLHAEGAERWRALCGLSCVWSAEFVFPSNNRRRRCKSCVRAVEAERKRLAASWEKGRMSTHPK